MNPKHTWLLWLGAIIMMIGLILLITSDPSESAPKPSHYSPAHPQLSLDLRAAAKLRSFGYVINNPAQLERAVQHWQRANGIWNRSCQCFDGDVGPVTAKSLGIGTSARMPTPPAAPAPASNPIPSVTPEPAAPDVPPPAYTGDIPDLIRSIWPDDSENWAVAISKRESNWQPGARNSCCSGLFQIHFRANRATLAELGITDPSQLLDAETNIRAALTIFERSGASPWLCHGQCTDIPL